MFKISGESLIGSYYVRYERLKELILSNFENSKDDQLDIYIDIYSILKSICRYNSNQLEYRDRFFIASGLVNMCAHYREYFKTRHQVTTRFFLINSTCDEIIQNLNQKYVQDYRKDYGNNFDSYYHKLFIDNMDVLQKLYPFLPGIYYIEVPFEFREASLSIMAYEKISYPAIVITKDIFNLTMLSLRKNLVILRPHKDNKNGNGIDDSYIINELNWFSYLCKERKVVIDQCEPLPPYLIPMILSLSKCPERNIKRLYNLDIVYKRIKEMLFEDMYNVCYYRSGLEEFCNAFINGIRTKKNPMIILDRFKIMDYSIIDTNNIGLWYHRTEMAGMNTLKELNETLFKNCPLDIQSL